MDPFNENVIYIGTSNANWLGTSKTDGIYKSENSGKTWTKVGLDSAQVNTIAIDKNNTDIIYAGVGKRDVYTSSEIIGIFKSTDGGVTWANSYSGEIDCVNDIIIDFSNSSIIYASINSKSGEQVEGAFLKSTNSGVSWIRRHISGSWYPKSYGLVQSPGSNGELYCISDAPGNWMDLWRSLNKGESWEPIYVYYFAGPLSAVVVDSQNTNTLYAVGSDVTDPGFYKSTNRGSSWNRVTDQIPNNIFRMLINPSDGRVTLTSYADGIIQSKSNGILWDVCPVNSYITDIAIHPLDDDTLFAAIAGDALYKSNDETNSWQIEGSTKSEDNIVAFSTSNPEIVAAASGEYFHKSTDGGDSFSNHYYSFMSGGDSHPEEILFKPNDENRIIVGTSGDDGVLSMSSNGGTQWGYIEFSTSAFVFDPADWNNIYAGTKNAGGVYKIEGVWGTSLNINDLTPSGGIGNVNDIAVDKDSKLYVAADDGFWNWDGSVWIKFDGLPADNITAVLLDENESFTNLYAGTENNGVYLSTDGGTSWTEFNNGLEKQSITKLAISETSSKRLYVGTKRGGVWSTDLVVGIDEDKTVLPSEFFLYQNYPNPFNPTTIIGYSIPKAGIVKLSVFDLLGREISTLVSKYQNQGNYKVEFDGQNLSSGVYFYRLKFNDKILTKKFLLMK